MAKDIATLRQVVDQAIDEHPRINRMEADITVLKAEQHRQGLLMEDMDRKMDRLVDASLPAKHREVQMDRLEDLTDSHEQRLGAVESTLNNHIGDRERHR